ncbi:MAG: FHA domain-containing protein [Lachnospiraceae bacterium]|nr:FHA domain-containing protein [Lachnospiraceae bacterium]
MDDLDKTINIVNQPVVGEDLLLTVFDAETAPITVSLLAFNKSVITFGRDTHNDIVLTSRLASRTHGRIILSNEKWYMEDTGSLNGLVHNSLVVKSVELSDKDCIRIDAENDTLVTGVLFVVSKPDSNAEWMECSIKGIPQITIGRDVNCTIRLQSRSVSSCHAVITWKNNQYHIFDNGSTNGVIVNGKHLINSTPLHEKDIIFLPQSKLVFTSSMIYYCYYGEPEAIEEVKVSPYEAFCTEYQVTNPATVRVISVSQEKEVLNALVEKLEFIKRLSGTSGFITIKEYKVVELDNASWEIYVLTEPLRPFTDLMAEKEYTEHEAARLGMVICSALESYTDAGMVHGDIRPESLFVTEDGTVLLADYGISGKMQYISNGITQLGSYRYASPEAFHDGVYNTKTDIYALGILLYQLLNKNRFPLCESNTLSLDSEEFKDALKRRLRGETLPAPCNASSKMAALILSACSADPAKRFAVPKALKNALSTLLQPGIVPPVSNVPQAPEPPVIRDLNKEAAPVEEDKTTTVRKSFPISEELDKTTTVRKTITIDELDRTSAVRKSEAFLQTEPQPTQKNTFGKKKSKWPVVVIILLLLIGIGAGVAYFAVPYIEDILEENNNKEEIDDILAMAEKRAEKEDYEGAVDILNDGSEDFPENERLEEQLEEYEAVLEESETFESTEEDNK